MSSVQGGMGIEKRILERKWFYRFELPSGRFTQSYLSAEVDKIHDTRLRMLFSVLDPLLDHAWSETTCIDLACHESFFSSHLARRGCKRILGIDAREEHIESSRLIRDVYELNNLELQVGDVMHMEPEAFGSFDVVLMFGLLYHLENPIGALRLAHALTARICLIETQVTPNLSGVTDWGSYQFTKRMRGAFAVIDEGGEEDRPESSLTGLSLCPSKEALVWILKHLGFRRVEVVPPPQDAYEQLASGKRVVVAAYR